MEVRPAGEAGRWALSRLFKSLGEVPVHLLKPRMVSVDVARIEQPEVPRSKWGNKPTVIDGVRYDSKLEGRCAQWLDLRWKAGEVLWYTRQVPFWLEGGVVYRADFVAHLKAGGVEVIDATGVLTQTKANKLKQMKARYGIDVILWSDNGRRYVDVRLAQVKAGMP